MPDYLHTSVVNGSEHEIQLKELRELLPIGQGYVEVKPNGDVVLSVPSGSGGGTSSGETFFTEEVMVALLNQLPECSRNPKYSGQDFQIITAWGDVYNVETGAFTVNPGARTLSIVAGAQFQFQVGWRLLYRYAVDASAGVPMLPFPSVIDNRIATALTGTLANGVSYTIRASNTASGDAWSAFNSDNIFDPTFWFSGVFPVGAEQWLEIEFSQNVRVGSVDIIAIAGLQPRNFRFQVGNAHSPAGTGYNQVFTRTGETWAGSGGETKTYAIPTPQSAPIFRIAISETTSNGNAPALYTVVLKA